MLDFVSFSAILWETVITTPKNKTSAIILINTMIVCAKVFVHAYHSKFFKSASKPKEKSRSASSTTNISRLECRTRFWALRCASTRDGVPTTTSGFSIKIGLFTQNRKCQPQTELLFFIRTHYRRSIYGL